MMPPDNLSLFKDIIALVKAIRNTIAVSVNAEMTLLYWTIGDKIKGEMLKDSRVEYGKQVIGKLSQNLTAEFGKGWGPRHLRDCIKRAEVFPDKAIVHTL